MGFKGNFKSIFVNESASETALNGNLVRHITGCFKCLTASELFAVVFIFVILDCTAPTLPYFKLTYEKIMVNNLRQKYGF